ncbi:hypothetical protein AS159_00640 [Thermotoga sp. Ku-13t]|uniref:type II toxin-antitoxin system HicA family toxin n=1 Tax=Thermotoga sp. Ku-13t TaxID=1755813 RepID=UPI0013EABC8F|nr:type II toxin-antitoxin system HicA family toxin [Thermotoga sp. Ku-13t]KAF2958258.1 hypothetical protein AS159_00640 [Thermotoga sp. Ku-13t]
MSYLPIVDPKTTGKVLLALGFQRVRQKGSHVFYRHSNGKYTTIPFHAKDLPESLIRKIIREAGISVEEFKKILENL